MSKKYLMARWAAPTEFLNYSAIELYKLIDLPIDRLKTTSNQLVRVALRLLAKRTRGRAAHLLVIAALFAAPFPASCENFWDKTRKEINNGMSDVRKAAPLPTAILTTVVLGPVGAAVVIKEQPKEAVVLAAVAGSLAVGCADGCTLAMSGLATIGGIRVAVPLGETNNAPAPSSQVKEPKGKSSSTVSPPAFPHLNDTPDRNLVNAPRMSQPQAPDQHNKRPHQPAGDSYVNAYLVSYQQRQRPKVGPYLETYYLPSDAQLSTYVKNPWIEHSTRSELASLLPEAPSSMYAEQLKAGPNLGDPWIKFTPQFSIQGAAGKWLQMAKMNVHSGQIRGSDFTFNPSFPIVSNIIAFDLSLGAGGPNSVGVTLQDPSGVLGAVSVGTTFGGGIPNATFDARMFNLSAGFKVEPDSGFYNALGQLERAVGQQYCSGWGYFYYCQ
ncbi:hypothetical protein [Massilia antarctica]|uniref:hypothetical protein n=1 Tax=Massilia antarctica TaxID=2765360 RepID=UPI00226F512C|nr:hypothetical protein [Massilia sp. H27-R4]MCY0916318.1 hypothetical protein [Massilia sp. H27-R4]